MIAILEKQRQEIHQKIVDTLDQISQLETSGKTPDAFEAAKALRSLSRTQLADLTSLEIQIATAS